MEGGVQRPLNVSSPPRLETLCRKLATVSNIERDAAITSTRQIRLKLVQFIPLFVIASIQDFHCRSLKETA